MVRQILRGGKFDTEDIACSIWIELFENKKHESWMYVRNRCYDVLRKESRMSLLRDEDLDRFAKPEEDTSYPPELLDIIINHANLGSDEREVLYKFFYRCDSVDKKQLNCILSKLRTEAMLLIGSLNL
jgi:hypothetical protein